MNYYNKTKKQINRMALICMSVAIGAYSLVSCEDYFEYDIAGEYSLEDKTLPTANFTAIQSSGAGEDDWKEFTFGNGSSSAIYYNWDFGDGSSSTEKEPTHKFAEEDTYTVTLTASDNNGAIGSLSKDVVVMEPIDLSIPDPVLINAGFDKQPKSSGSDCACAGWINKSVGDQGESSSGNGGSDNVLKFDNNEPDHIYQEFEVSPNADYTLVVVTSFKPLTTGGLFPSMLELRVLAGAGYTTGYTPTYYATAAEYPQDGFGYASVAQLEDPANNLLTEVQVNPNDDGYITYTYSFNAGANNSVAMFMRGIGGPSTGGAGGDFGYNSGDEEIRLDSVTITAVN